MPRGAGNHVGKDTGISMEIPDLSRLRLEDKEYFSGSLIETKKVETPALRRSSSYNADRYVTFLLSNNQIPFSKQVD